MGQRIDIFGNSKESVDAAKRDAMIRARESGRKAHGYIVFKNREGKWQTAVDFCAPNTQRGKIDLSRLATLLSAKHGVIVKW